MPNNLTLATLDAIEAAERAATPGPWSTGGDFIQRAGVIRKWIWGPREKLEHQSGLRVVCDQAPMKDDAEFIALARNNTPALVAALRGALRIERAREAVEKAKVLWASSVQLFGSCSHEERLRLANAADQAQQEYDNAIEAFRNDNPGLLPETVSGEEDHAE